jgi:hypothetical protein
VALVVAEPLPVNRGQVILRVSAGKQPNACKDPELRKTSLRVPYREAEEKREELLRRKKENHERPEPDFIHIGSCNEIKEIR